MHGILEPVGTNFFYSSENGGWYFESALMHWDSQLYPEVFYVIKTENGYVIDFVNAAVDNLVAEGPALCFEKKQDSKYVTMNNFPELLMGQHYIAVLEKSGDGYVLRSVNNRDKVFVPFLMKEHSVIVYDDELNYTVLQGGELTEADIASKDYLSDDGLVSESYDMLAEPNIKAEYDLHGFIQNIYYPVPGNPTEYQLEKPRTFD